MGRSAKLRKIAGNNGKLRTSTPPPLLQDPQGSTLNPHPLDYVAGKFDTKCMSYLVALHLVPKYIRSQNQMAL